MKVHVDENDTWLARPPTTDKLTEFEMISLDLMPVDEWFKPLDLHHLIRRPEATCERLHLKGYLDRSITNAPIGFAKFIYKLANSPSPTRS